MNLSVVSSSSGLPPAQNSHKWNSERMDYLTQRWADGASASQIGQELRVTRNTIIGKAHRLHLPARKSRVMSPEAKAKKAKSKLPRMKMKQRPPQFGPMPPTEPMPAPAPLLPGSEPVAFVDLQGHHCRYPIELEDGSTGYCGAKKKDGFPYCPYHVKRCYNPVQR